MQPPWPPCPCLASKPRCRQLGTGSFPQPGHKRWPRIMVLPLGRDNVQSTAGKRVRGCSSMRWVPARLRVSTDNPGCPSPRQRSQARAGPQHRAALCRPRLTKPAAAAPSRSAGREQGACQPAGTSMTLLPWVVLVPRARRAAMPLGPPPRHRQKPPLTPCQPSRAKISLPCVSAG